MADPVHPTTRCAVCLVVHTGVPPFGEQGRMTTALDGIVTVTLDVAHPLPAGARVVIDPEDVEAPRLLGQVVSCEGSTLSILIQRTAPRERRGAPRYAAAMALDYWAPSAPGPARAGPLVEVAIGGLAFDVVDALCAGDHVSLRFTIPGEPHPTLGSGEVVRVVALMTGRQRVSVSLDPDDQVARQALARFSSSIQDAMFGGPPPGRQARRRRYPRGAVSAR